MRCGKASRSPTGPTLSEMIAVLGESWGSWAGLTAAEGGAGGDARGYDNDVTCVDADADAENCAGAGDCVAAWDDA